MRRSSRAVAALAAAAAAAAAAPTAAPTAQPTLAAASYTVVGAATTWPACAARCEAVGIDPSVKT